MTGFVTLPVEEGYEKFSLELAEKLGADALRNSDGTILPDDLLLEKYNIYSTLCITRADQAWAGNHMEHCPEKYLMSEPETAFSNEIQIDLMSSFYKEKYVIDTRHDPYIYWEVRDRTSGMTVEKSSWKFNRDTGMVSVCDCKKYHQYTVSFLVYQIWDSVSMYNHLTNNWTSPHIVATDPYHPASYQHMMEYLESWMDHNPDVNVVRLTSLAYSFTLDSNQYGSAKFVDWLGYTDCVSPAALDDFEKQYGYRLEPEDFVNKGLYNSTQLVPSKKYLDWIDFIHHFVNRFGRDMVDRIHKRGKKAGLFWGDHWIGVETYSELFKEMGIDINIGACEDGNALRRLADCPAECTKEIRLYPYFFPDVFCEGGNPTGESISNWVKIRRAMLRKPVDRIGWGGYLSLIKDRPDFIRHIQGIADEFRSIIKNGGKTEPHSSGLKVLIINSWGKRRAWINSISLEQQFSSARADVVTIFGSNMLECLSGLPVDVCFSSFDEIIENGIPDDIDVIINEGVTDGAWSGGDYWKNTVLIEAVRNFVANGGGIIGLGSPSAVLHEGRFFQLSDIFGVDLETGKTLDRSSLPFQVEGSHFITDDLNGKFDAGLEKTYIRLTDRKAKIVAANGKHIYISANEYGSGRGSYIATLPYSSENSRLLYRTILWVSGRDKTISEWFPDNQFTECAFFPETGMIAVINNSGQPQRTVIECCKNRKMEINLQPYELTWIENDKWS